MANSDGSIVLTTEVDESGINKFKSGIGSLGKALGGAATAAAASFAAVTAAAAKSYASYEQLAGGVETLFKDSSDVVQGYADKAYMTAGLSANDYMETVTGFSASLLQSLGGDTAKAAEYGNQAVADMADNANKMGTSMESIQNAYQGFAKQNYTMLDNLKLGYGGTKEEMQRLLDDATKLSGIKYDISSFADITQAIHVIQKEMEITGTTALEAEQTISGSANMIKASWQNMLTGFADAGSDMSTLTENFVKSVNIFAQNLMPVLENSAKGIVKFLPSLLTNAVSLIMQMLPSVISAVTGIFTSLAAALPQMMTTLTAALPTLVGELVGALPTLIPQLVGGVVQAVAVLAGEFEEIISPVIDSLPDIITSINLALIENLPILINGCIELIAGVVRALPKLLFAQWKAAVLVAVQMGEALFNTLPEPIKNAFTAAFEAIKAVWNEIKPYFDALWDSIRIIFSVAENVLGGFFSAAYRAVTAVWSVASGFFSAVWESIKGVFTDVALWFQGVFTSAVNAVKTVFADISAFFGGVWVNIKSAFKFEEMADIGANIVRGLWNGIGNMTEWLASKIRSFCSGALEGIKSFFGIHSPSRIMRDEVGKNLVLGVAEGIEAHQAAPLAALTSVAASLTNVPLPQIATPVPYFAGAISRTETPNVGERESTASGVSVIKEEHYNLNQTELMAIIYKLAKGGERLSGASLVNGGGF